MSNFGAVADMFNRFNFKPFQPLQYQLWTDGQKCDINIARQNASIVIPSFLLAN